MNSRKTQTLNQAKKLKTGKDLAGQVYYFVRKFRHPSLLAKSSLHFFLPTELYIRTKQSPLTGFQTLSRLFLGRKSVNWEMKDAEISLLIRLAHNASYAINRYRRRRTAAQKAHNLVLIGGTGKTGIAISILRQALINGYRGRFYKAQDLIDELYASLADRSSTRLLKRLSSLDVLLIDLC